MDDFEAAFKKVGNTIREVVPVVVRRHRAAGILTWRLMHQIEAEVLGEVAATGAHNSRILGMMRSSPLMEYPKDDREVSLEGHDVVPIVFGEVHKAWGRVD